MRAEIYIDRYVVAVVGHRENIFIINSGRGPTRKQLRVLSRIFRERFTSFSLSGGEFLLVSHGAFLLKDFLFPNDLYLDLIGDRFAPDLFFLFFFTMRA